MQIVGTVVSHCREIEVLEDVEHLQEHGTLTVEGLLVDRVAAVGRARGLFDARIELAEVLELERLIVLLEKRDHLLGDVAFVKTVTRRRYGRFTALRAGRTFRRNETAESTGEQR